MDSLGSLNTALPPNEQAEALLASSFRQAALSITALFKQGKKATSKGAFTLCSPSESVRAKLTELTPPSSSSRSSSSTHDSHHAQHSSQANAKHSKKSSSSSKRSLRPRTGMRERRGGSRRSREEERRLDRLMLRG